MHHARRMKRKKSEGTSSTKYSKKAQRKKKKTLQKVGEKARKHRGTTSEGEGRLCSSGRYALEGDARRLFQGFARSNQIKKKRISNTRERDSQGKRETKSRLGGLGKKIKEERGLHKNPGFRGEGGSD